MLQNKNFTFPFFKINLFIYLFIYLFLAVLVFVAVCRLSLVAVGGASHCCGFSCCGARALGAQASVVVAPRLSSCGLRALELRLSSCGARA